MKHIKLLTIICALIAINSFGQQQNWNWYFGDGAAVNFSSGNPVSISGSAISTVEGCSCVSDAVGHLLFYTDGITVWNRNNIAMPNGTLLNGNSSSTQSAVICPKPDSAGIYYIFTTDCCGSTHGLCYSEVDTSLNAGLGNVTVKNAQLITPTAEKVCIVRHDNGIDFWVVTHGYNDNDSIYYVYLVTAAGVQPPVLTHIGNTSNSFIGYLKASPNGKKICAANAYGVDSIQIFDFNNCSGVLSNCISISSTANSGPYGVSFSPNDSVLYVANELTPSVIYQWDISSNNQATINASRYSVVSGAEDDYMGLQLGVNNKIYVARYVQAFISVINSPNTLGAGCNFVDGAVPLTSGTSMIGLPNLVDAYVAAPLATSENINVVSCATVDSLSPTGTGTSYIWSTGATTESIGVSVAGTYWVHVIGANACNQVVNIADTFNVTFAAHPIVNLGPNQTVCGTGPDTLNVGNPGDTYTWSTSATTQSISVTTTNTYYVTVSNGGCSTTDSILVTFVTNPTVNLGPDTTICSNDSITLNAGNTGFSYLWNTGATTQTITVHTAGTYEVNVSQGVCHASDSTIITIGNTPQVNLGPNSTICSNHSLTLNAGNPGDNYSWSTGATTETITVDVSGTYWVHVSIAACSANDTVIITVVQEPSVSLGPDTTLCNGNTVILNAGNPGCTYLWSNGTTVQSIVVSTPGIYWVHVNQQQCLAGDTVVISFIDAPVVNLGPDRLICIGNNFAFDAGNPGFSYLWSNGSTNQTLTVTAAGTYWVKVDDGGCIGGDTVIVTTAAIPVVNLGQPQNLCYGQEVTLNAENTGFSYRWSTGQTTQTISANATGFYYVAVNNSGCIGTDTVDIIIDNQILVSLGADTFLCPGSQLYIDAGIGFASYFWNPEGGNGHFIIVYEPGTYIVTVTDSEGCTATSSKFVRDYCPSNLYIPNTFTPSININNMFMPVGSNVVSFHMYIFDRWGETLFESTDITVGWDGTYNGNNVPQGVYIYRIDYTQYDFLQLMKHSVYGNVNLIR